MLLPCVRCSQNMGQNCIGIERILVHASLYDQLFEYFEEKVSRMRVGSVLALSPEGYISTVDGGSMINGDRFEGLEKVIHEAEEAGATIIGGKAYKHVYLENGYYFQPTLIGNVDPSMDIANHEGALELPSHNLLGHITSCCSFCPNWPHYALRQDRRSRENCQWYQVRSWCQCLGTRPGSLHEGRQEPGVWHGVHQRLCCLLCAFCFFFLGCYAN